jgi:hypothetical protein
MSAWLDRLKTLDSAKDASAKISEISETLSEAPGKGDNGDNGDFGTGICVQNEVPWHEREDVRLVVEDLFRERWHPYRIGKHLGLTRVEVGAILRLRDTQPSTASPGGLG